MGAAEQVQQHANQASLFDLLATPAQDSGLVLQTQLPAWTESERLQQEKMALGLYLSGHPFDPYRVELRQIAKTSFGTFTGWQRIAVGCRSGDECAQQNDSTRPHDVCTYRRRECSAWSGCLSWAFGTLSCHVARRLFLVLAVKVSPDDYSFGGLRLVAEEIFDLAQARVRLVQRVRLRLPVGASTALAAALRSRSGGGKITTNFHYVATCVGASWCEIGYGVAHERWRGEFTSFLRLAYGADSVQWQF